MVVQIPWGGNIEEAEKEARVAKVVTGRDESIQSAAIGLNPRKMAIILFYLFLLFFQMMIYFSYF